MEILINSPVDSSVVPLDEEDFIRRWQENLKDVLKYFMNNSEDGKLVTTSLNT